MISNGHWLTHTKPHDCQKQERHPFTIHQWHTTMFFLRNLWLIKYTEWKDTFQFSWPPTSSIYKNKYLKQWCLVSCSISPSLLHFSFIAGINLELYFQLQVIYLCACSTSSSHHFSSIFYCMHLEWFGWLYVVNSHFYLMYIICSSF